MRLKASMLIFFINIVVIAYASEKLYSMSNSKVTWYEASKACEEDGGYLLTLNSEDVYKDLVKGHMKKSISDEQLWIGLKVALGNQHCQPHYWHSGEPLGRWYNWAVGEPNYCLKDTCVKMGFGGWKTTSCRDTYKFICEKIEDLTDGSTDLLLPTVSATNDQTNKTSVLPASDSGSESDLNDSTEGSTDVPLTTFSAMNDQIKTTSVSPTDNSGSESGPNVSATTVTTSVSPTDVSGSERDSNGAQLRLTSTMSTIDAKETYGRGSESDTTNPVAVRTDLPLMTTVPNINAEMETISVSPFANDISGTFEFVTKSSAMKTVITMDGHTDLVLLNNSEIQDNVPNNQSTHDWLNSSTVCCNEEERELKCGRIEWIGVTNKALEAQIEKLKNDLKVLRNSTQIYIRSKISVDDKRSSSMAVGMMAVVVITLVCCFPVAIDSLQLIGCIKKVLRCQQISKRVADNASA